MFLFDEPLSNLDAKMRVHMRLELAKLHDRLQTTIIYVTHDQLEAMTLATQVALMKEGKLVAVGTVSEVMTYRRLKETFDAELYCGENEINGKRFFLPMRKNAEEKTNEE